MAKIIEANKRSYGHIRTVKIQVGDCAFNNEKLPKTLAFPMHKLQLLVEKQVVRFPDGETVAFNGQDDISS